ncbi:amino acid ABC transporter permease [Vibrio ziniensis]|uniref:Amino acid ABC transporter permease n=1 Tax=Vibrio ziniensis TaxID=2711221 RepID=A0A6G7CJ34_9VIBR|nr:amino acid ABC transporter permease [Vibrio ziniensis]QIH42080.1 amino acid ABC transporter permease [Vibrio ziniensis]
MFDTSFSTNDLSYMLQGAWLTLQLTFWAMLIGTAFGIVFGLLRTMYPKRTIPLGWFLDIFRSVPLLIQFVLFNSFKSIANLPYDAFQVAAVVLGVYTAAFCTEIVRSGILSVPEGLSKASRSLGMTQKQTLLYIVLPLATRISFPGWVSLALSVMKDSALVMWIGVIELLRASQSIITRIQEPLLVLCVAGLFYYVMSLVIARVGVKFERRWQIND